MFHWRRRLDLSYEKGLNLDRPPSTKDRHAILPLIVMLRLLFLIFLLLWELECFVVCEVEGGSCQITMKITIPTHTHTRARIPTRTHTQVVCLFHFFLSSYHLYLFHSVVSCMYVSLIPLSSVLDVFLYTFIKYLRIHVNSFPARSRSWLKMLSNEGIGKWYDDVCPSFRSDWKARVLDYVIALTRGAWRHDSRQNARVLRCFRRYRDVDGAQERKLSLEALLRRLQSRDHVRSAHTLIDTYTQTTANTHEHSLSVCMFVLPLCLD